MAEMIGETVESAGLDPYVVLGMVLAETERRFGIAPEAVEEKAALEARRAVDQASLDGVPVSWKVIEDKWSKGKMETPGVQLYDYEQMLHLAVPSGHGAEVLQQIRAYWLSRGMNVLPEAESPAGDVVASPGKGEWTLRAGVLDPVTVFVRVASGYIPMSSSKQALGKEL